MDEKKTLDFTLGIRTSLAEGKLLADSPFHMTTEIIYHGGKGSKILFDSNTYVYAIALYSKKMNKEYTSSFKYQKESNWTSYTKNLTPDAYTTETYVFDHEYYFRICIKRMDGQRLNYLDVIQASECLQFMFVEPQYVEKAYFIEESIRVAQEIGQVKTKVKSSLTLAIVTDTHYTVGGTWEDTANNVQLVHRKSKFDAIVHLGDLTDGITSAKVTKYYVNKVIGDLQKCQIPLHITIGNHDANYYQGNPDVFNEQEQIELYLKNEKTDKPYYYVDYTDHRIRCFFLSSYKNNEPIRYGYSIDELLWLEEALESMQEGGNILVFSHDAPLAALDYWSETIRNGDALIQILEKYNQRDEYHILGLFYGHTHADYIYDACSFPMISVACNKFEEFQSKKPYGAIVPKRQYESVTQDLWDTLVVDLEGKMLNLIRFGAGTSRQVDCSKKTSTFSPFLGRIETKKKVRQTKIWAHRGVLAYAPENTMPAFELADQYRVDGIELDVQLTKDGEIVIIHDETIDRVSNGSGYVKDYSLDELKRFNFNRRFPEYGKISIPTLEEVYAFVKKTDLLVNVELKNNHIYYEGLEEKVIALTKKMEMEARVLYSSFNHQSMNIIRTLDKGAQVALLYTKDIVPDMKRIGVVNQHITFEHLKNPLILEIVKKNPSKFNFWTVNDEDQLKYLKDIGVTNVITNSILRAMTLFT